MAPPNAEKAKAALATLLTTRGNILLKQHRMADAIAAYEKAAAVSTNPGVAYFNICALLYNQGRMQEVVPACDKAIAAYPAKADAYFIKGSALFGDARIENGKMVLPDGAVQAFQKYLELAPSGSHVTDVKAMLTSVGQTIETTYRTGSETNPPPPRLIRVLPGSARPDLSGKPPASRRQRSLLFPEIPIFFAQVRSPLNGIVKLQRKEFAWLEQLVNDQGKNFRAKRRERAKFVAVFHSLRIRADKDIGPLPNPSPIPIEFVKAGAQLCWHACDLGIQARALFDGNLVRRSIENERRLRGEQHRDPGDHEASCHGCKAPETVIGSTPRFSSRRGQYIAVRDTWRPPPFDRAAAFRRGRKSNDRGRG